MITVIDFDLLTVILLFLIYIPIFVVLRCKMKKSKPYLIVVSVFYVYICEVINYTQFPIIISDEMEYNILKNLNYVPFLHLSSSDISTSILNVILSIPFGFFVTILKRQTIRKTALFGVSFGAIIEGFQFLVATFIGNNLRVIDINDIIFNFIGVYIGFIIYHLFRLSFIKIIKAFSIEPNELLTFCFIDK